MDTLLPDGSLTRRDEERDVQVVRALGRPGAGLVAGPAQRIVGVARVAQRVNPFARGAGVGMDTPTAEFACGDGFDEPQLSSIGSDGATVRQKVAGALEAHLVQGSHDSALAVRVALDFCGRVRNATTAAGAFEVGSDCPAAFARKAPAPEPPAQPPPAPPAPCCVGVQGQSFTHRLEYDDVVVNVTLLDEAQVQAVKAFLASGGSAAGGGRVGPARAVAARRERGVELVKFLALSPFLGENHTHAPSPRLSFEAGDEGVELMNPGHGSNFNAFYYNYDNVALGPADEAAKQVVYSQLYYPTGGGTGCAAGTDPYAGTPSAPLPINTPVEALMTEPLRRVRATRWASSGSATCSRSRARTTW